MIQPQWIEKYGSKNRGRDHLAYEYVGVLMLERLLPGISNITNRARYYSFFAWVFYRFFEKTDLPKTEKNFRHYLRVKSLVFLYANGLQRLNESNTGIDGIELVREDLQKNGDRDVFLLGELELIRYKDNFWIYSQKIKQLKLTEENKDYGLDSLTNRGKEVAEAFEKSIKHTMYFQDYCDKIETVLPFNIQIPANVLIEYGQACDVLGLKNSNEERKVLLEAFCRLKEIKAENLSPSSY
jgi:hypothetical protein